MLTHVVYQQTYRKLDTAQPVENFRCPYCSSLNIAAIKEPDRLVAVCMNATCETLKNVIKTTQKTNMKTPRALPFQKFCELSDIGNKFWNITFEKIFDTPKKTVLEQFAFNPKGLLILQGSPGLGKTFSCFGLLELYTRISADCSFYKGFTLKEKWLNYSRGIGDFNLKNRLLGVELLVIDDFATSEPSPAFMDFFLEIIDNRLQWNNRGTVITTNLEPEKMAQICGEALSDRIQTGQFLFYDGESHR